MTRTSRTGLTLLAALPALAALLGGLKLNRERMRAAAQSPLLLATAVADAMAAKGTPFREAHERVGRELASIDKLAKQHGVTLESILAKKNAFGGTSPERVKEAAAKMQERLR